MRQILIPLLCLPAMAHAQDANGIAFTLGLGAQSQPGYFGADDNEVGPGADFEFGRLQFGSISLGGRSRDGLRFGGSARFIDERSADDYPELEGLDDIDFSLEVGGGLEFNAPDYELFAKLRYGVIGHEALVAELGGDLIIRPDDQVTLRAGPRLLWGSEDFTQTYFGVTPEESAASDFNAFEPGAGLVSAGVAAEATYQFNDTWGVAGKVRYDRLQDDAADSPITQSEDQLTGSVVITRRISFGF
ncbi:MipA/OmpV family protein [Cognatiyoonia sp. IB215446]|uniref:MipA/OmpV family protein n=1 Tax=Cognatiyoonia sp. IB215446 TaxID=3097355 RepID=UPI002A16ABD0|nr:MipA/OmpV family protein [Cognatiyoonia sp. IB215446]MDX8348276.1 MipA/OmpV family protein [Cognatiyoonia sp. IB215446]